MAKQNGNGNGSKKAAAAAEPEDQQEDSLEVGSDEEAGGEIIDPIPELAPAKASKKGFVKVNCVYPININGKEHFGVVEVTREVAEVLCEMLYKKRKSDLDVHIGRNYNVDRLTDNTLIINETGTPRKG